MPNCSILVRITFFVLTLAITGCQGLLMSADEKIATAQAQIQSDNPDYEVLAKATEWLRVLSDEGNPEASYWMARIYFKGLGVEQDYTKMLSYYRKAASKGHATAMHRLAQNYRYGRGVEKDIDQAIRHYENAIAAGSAEALGDLASVYYNGDGGISRDFQTSYRYAKQGAELGDVYSLNVLSKHYINQGSGFFSPEKAVDSYEKLVKKSDDFEHRFVLSTLYTGAVHSNPNLINLDKAEELMKAVPEDSRDADRAAFSLANIYMQKRRVAPEDKKKVLYEKAMAFMRKAANLGNADASGVLCFEQGGNWNNESSEYHSKIRNWCLTAAEDGDPRSQFNVGVIMQEDDPDDAFKWFKLSALQGHEMAERIADQYGATITSEQRVKAYQSIREYLDTHQEVANRVKSRSVFE